jgi:hypothetical protein
VLLVRADVSASRRALAPATEEFMVEYREVEIARTAASPGLGIEVRSDDKRRNSRGGIRTKTGKH